MKRNPGRHISSGFASANRPVWKSPTVYFIIALLVAALVVPFAIDAQTPVIISALYVDVSASNQPFQKQATAICQERLTYLKKRDVIINAQFADQVAVLPVELYRAQKKVELRQNCARVLEPSDGLGKRPGTSFHRALVSLRSQIQRQQRDQKKRIRTVAIFLLQAAEAVPGQPKPDWKAIKQHIKALTDDGSAVLVMGVEAELQQQLISLLGNMHRVEVLAYSKGQSDLKRIFSEVRRQ